MGLCLGLESVVIVLFMVWAIVGRGAILATFQQISLYCFFAQAVKAFSPESSDMSEFLERRSNLSRVQNSPPTYIYLEDPVLDLCRIRTEDI